MGFAIAIPEAAITPARPEGFRELAAPRPGFFLSLSLSLSLDFFFWSVLAAEDMDMLSESRGVETCKERLPFACSTLWMAGADWGMFCIIPSIPRILPGDSTMGDMVTTAVATTVGASGVSADSVYERPLCGGTIIGAGILRDLFDVFRRMS